jgi:CheY-like chemotaxis protein
VARILIIDDDRDFLSLMDTFLRGANHRVLALTKGERVVEEIREFKPDLVITDIMMPGITGGSIYAAIRKHIGSHLPLIVCSATKMRVGARRDPLLEHCPKPLDLASLAEAIDRLLSAAQGGKEGET